jgi:hypothetical protein
MSTCRILFKVLVPAAMLSATAVTPLRAQQVMSEPAYCAFYYPNANCQNKGPGNPYTDPNYRANGGQSSGYHTFDVAPNVAPRRWRTHRYDSMTTRMQ